MAKEMVKVQATKTAVTTVRGERLRINIVTNKDKKAAEAAAEGGEQNTHTFITTKSIADQLVDKKVAKIVDDKVSAEDGDAEPIMGSTTTAEAKKRLEKNAEADQAGSTVSGADTRDTTAFAQPPLEEATATNPAPAEEAASSTADAPPAGEEGDASDAGKKAAPKKAPAKKS